MFGYIRAKKEELKLREYEYYSGVYCGLCRSLGKCGGQCARLTLSYDFVFMALVRMSLASFKPSFKPRRCMAHPFKKRTMADYNSQLEFCAAASLLLSYHKIRDDLFDERGIKRMRAAVAGPIFLLMKRRASKKYEALEGEILKGMRALSQYEKENQYSSIDRPAEIFGELLSAVMSEGLEGSKGAIARKIGLHIGKWIYILDAADDYDDDVKKGRFNPIVTLCGSSGLTNAQRENLKLALKNELAEAEKAFDLIDYCDFDSKNVIENIIYLGIPEIANRIIEKNK